MEIMSEPQDSALQAEKQVASPVSLEKKHLIPAFLCAFLCIILMRTGFFSLFFLVPVGFCAAAFGSAAAWLCFVLAFLGNGALSAGFSLFLGTGPSGAVKDALYFTVLTLGFTWIMAGNPPENSPVPRIPKIRTAFRFTIAAVAGAAAFLAVTFAGGGSELLFNVIFSRTEAVSAAIIASSGTDVVRQSFLESVITPERVMQTLSAVALRGGALVSAFFIFFFSRQTAFILIRLFRRQKTSTAGDLTAFYAPRGTIWFFSFSFLIVIIGRAVSLEIVEIAAWNLLIICAVMFLAQGAGIVIFALTRRPMPPMFRLIFVLALILAVLSPGVNIVALGALVILGVAENWLPMRKITVSNEQ